MKMDFLVICLSPTIQKTLILPEFHENEVNRSSEYRFDAAGKGMNTTRILTQLGGNAVHLTQSGDRIEFLKELIEADNIQLVTAANRSAIRTCTTIINLGGDTVTEIVEESTPVDEGAGDSVMNIYTKLLKKTEYVIIAGSKAQGFNDSIFPEMVRLAKKADKKIILDYRGKDLLGSIPDAPDIIKINFPEFVSTFFPDQLIGEHEDNLNLKKMVCAKMIELMEHSGIRTILTRGTMPVLYADEGIIKEAPVKKIKPLNTIGSGDAFTAGLAFKLKKGSSMQEAVQFASECGAKNAALLRPGVIR